MNWEVIELHPDEIEHSIYDSHFWIDQIRFRKDGYYQKCDSCNLIGRSLSDLDLCPACGGTLAKEAVLAFGGLIAVLISHR